MHVHYLKNPDACCGCGACASACKLTCIDMLPDTEGFLYPQTDENICVKCGVCEKVCPMLLTPRQGESPTAFAAWNRDAAVRAESSSGGVFSALVQKTFQQGGVVIGAAFDSNMILCHQSAQNEAESYKFRGSKYLQSVIGNMYREAQEYLHKNRRVLFSGTPCQIAGLYSFLGNDDKNLLTCDLICHGVPSPKVFNAYKDNLEKLHDSKVRQIAFRRKDYGWKQYSLSVTFNNDIEYCRTFTVDPFMLGFLRDIYLRPSCHTCKFSRLPRVADITLGDFWGVGEHHPEWDDDRGTSLILVQTTKGHVAFTAARDILVVHEADLNVAISSNPSICSSVPPRQNREAFFSDLDRLSFDKIIKKYMSPSPFENSLVNLLMRVVRRLNSIFKT